MMLILRKMMSKFDKMLGIYMELIICLMKKLETILEEMLISKYNG
jgi:hypothetical protein